MHTLVFLPESKFDVCVICSLRKVRIAMLENQNSFKSIVKFWVRVYDNEIGTKTKDFKPA